MLQTLMQRALYCVAVRYNVLQCVAMSCSAMQHGTVCCSVLYFVCQKGRASNKGLCQVWCLIAPHCNALQHAATHCNTLEYTAIHYNTLQYTAPRRNTPQHTTTHRNTLQHTATHCNTPQHTATHCNTLLVCNTLQHRPAGGGSGKGGDQRHALQGAAYGWRLLCVLL